MTPFQGFKKANETIVYSNLQDGGVRQQPKHKLGQLVRTADIKRVFTKGDSTNFFYRLNTITEVIPDTVPSYRINYLLGRYIQNSLLLTKLTLDEKNQVMNKLKLFQ